MANVWSSHAAHYARRSEPRPRFPYGYHDNCGCEWMAGLRLSGFWSLWKEAECEMDMRVLYWLSCDDGKIGARCVSSESHIDFVFVRHPGGKRGEIVLKPPPTSGGSPQEWTFLSFIQAVSRGTPVSSSPKWIAFTKLKEKTTLLLQYN